MHAGVKRLVEAEDAHQQLLNKYERQPLAVVNELTLASTCFAPGCKVDKAFLRPRPMALSRLSLETDEGAGEGRGTLAIKARPHPAACLLPCSAPHLA